LISRKHREENKLVRIKLLFCSAYVILICEFSEGFKNDMKKKYKHTAIIMAFGESPYLEKCICSLKKQTVKSRVLMSTSTPSAFLSHISEKYHIPLLINNLAKGIASDWSFAYNNCKTRYVTLVHQDDLYLPEYTEACLAVTEKQSNKTLITFTDYYEMFGGRTRSMTLNLFIKKVLLSTFLFKDSINSYLAKKSILFFGNSISCPSVMYNKDHIGSFEFSKEFCCNVDWDAWLRLSSMKGSFVYVKKPLMVHRIHDAAQTFRQIKTSAREEEDKKIFKKLWPKPIAKILSKLYYFGANSRFLT